MIMLIQTTKVKLREKALMSVKERKITEKVMGFGGVSVNMKLETQFLFHLMMGL